MPTIIDDEFGQITVRRNARSRRVTIRLTPDGTLRASAPLYAPDFLVKRLLKDSRAQLRAMVNTRQLTSPLYDGMAIGKSHRLTIMNEAADTSVQRKGRTIILSLGPDARLGDAAVQQQVKKEMVKALRLEAKHHLPRRLVFLAEEYGYSYSKVRFSHASGRWGSCSSNGTISLNIALMKLPFDLIDYVILHELAHTKHMNHSRAFWNQLAVSDPDYKEHRRQLKSETPAI